MKKYALVSGFIGFIIAFICVGVISAERYSKATMIEEVEAYLAKQYPSLNYSIGAIHTPTDFDFYGYFHYEVEIKNVDMNEKFYVVYANDMGRLEDSLKIEATEQWLKDSVEPGIQQYLADRSSEIRYIDVGYFFKKGVPLIDISFHENTKNLTKQQFDELVQFIEQDLQVKHAIVITYSWLGNDELSIEY